MMIINKCKRTEIVTTRNLTKYRLAEQMAQPIEQSSAQQSSMGIGVVFVLPLLAILLFHQVIGLLFMVMGLLAPVLVVYWLVQLEDDTDY